MYTKLPVVDYDLVIELNQENPESCSDIIIKNNDLWRQHLPEQGQHDRKKNALLGNLFSGASTARSWKKYRNGYI